MPKRKQQRKQPAAASQGANNQSENRQTNQQESEPNTSIDRDTSCTGSAAPGDTSCTAGNTSYTTSTCDDNSRSRSGSSSTGGNTASCSSSGSSSSSSCSQGDDNDSNLNKSESDQTPGINGRCEEPVAASGVFSCTEIVVTEVADPCIASSSQSGAYAADIDTIVDATTFEDAQESSNRWPSSSRDDTSSGCTSGQQDQLLPGSERFATPTAGSAVVSTADENSGLTTEPDDTAAATAGAAAGEHPAARTSSDCQDDDNDDTPMPQLASSLQYQTVLEDAPDRPLPAAAAVERQLQELPTAAVSQEEPAEVEQPATRQDGILQPAHTQQPRHRSSPPRGVYGGPGTAFPATLLRRRLAAFPVVLPDDGAIDPGDAETANQLADRLAVWESADADGRCGVCQRPADRANSGGFLGYPVCDCAHLHARCALVGALLEAPDPPRCLGCGFRQQLHRVGRVKPLLTAACRRSNRSNCDQGAAATSGPLGEAWFVVSMATGLSTSAVLLAVAAALLLTLAEPLTRGLLAGASLPLLGCLFGLLAAAILACVLIGWFLDRHIAAVWEQVYSSRLQIGYKADRLNDPADRVLAASLMACTFLDYHTAGYPFPKRGGAYVNYYCLKQPATACAV
ncbi:hypothetical protein BOX15_Mlig022326g1 [Macrostomum lignano]|uniref:Uncharacterized protein n=2 Tax=Macrostomum lignano TaxID=282301 RepID=A0A267E549_9PLAT|nr:hypothetical protein BOX15_Mlig022326g1 [Macrostomum lignano]